MDFPKKLLRLLHKRKHLGAFRTLPPEDKGIDFSSNDYLGLSKTTYTTKKAYQELQKEYPYLRQQGSTGSRLLTGNNHLHDDLEIFLSSFYDSESSLVFNSGYNANLGLLASVPQRGDIVIFDELVHTSIREGIRLSNAKSIKHKHLDYSHLKKIVSKIPKETTKYLVTESVFSMDGDTPDLEGLVFFCKENKIYLIIDEAHAIGVFGNGLVTKNKLENNVFARVVTFGKAMGCHGAAVLGSRLLRDYLINFSRCFIYTTALPPHSLAMIWIAHKNLNHTDQNLLSSNIIYFRDKISRLNLGNVFIPSKTAIQSCIVSGNEKTKYISEQLKINGYDVKSILSPTVPEGLERLRFCLHSFNTKTEIAGVLDLLKKIMI